METFHLPALHESSSSFLFFFSSSGSSDSVNDDQKSDHSSVEKIEVRKTQTFIIFINLFFPKDTLLHIL